MTRYNGHIQFKVKIIIYAKNFTQVICRNMMFTSKNKYCISSKIMQPGNPEEINGFRVRLAMDSAYSDIQS